MVQKDTSVDIDVSCDGGMLAEIERDAKKAGISVDEWILRAIRDKLDRDSGKCGRDKRADILTDDTPPEYNAKK